MKQVKRCVISGATGAIGTALVQELVSQGIQVLVLARKDSARLANLPKHPLVQIKNCSLDELSTLENDTGPCYDVFYHFAWAGTSGPARNDMYLQTENIRYSLDAVGAAKRFGCHTFIGAGSQAEYGRVSGFLHPDTPAFPEMGYGYAKLCAGLMTRDLAHQLGLEHVWVRVLSVYGPHDAAQSMVMSTIQKLRNGEVPSFTPAEQLWDYLYSGDAARAFRLLGEKGIDGCTYVLGSGSAEPLRSYILKIRDAVAPGAEIAIGALPYAPRQVMHLQADTSALKEDTGWEPKTAFADGIAQILSSL